MSHSKRRFLFVSIDSLIGDSAWQVVRAGNKVRYIQSDGISMPVGDFLYGMASGELKTFNANSKDRVIIFRKPKRDGVHIEDVREV